MEEVATIGGGCYWCLEAFYKLVNGVTKVESGYSGGTVDNPTANRVYEGDTGHAEVVQITFNPSVISYNEILEIFFVMHDPTTVNRQGNDVGDEYRSVIFYHNQEQQKIAEEMINGFASEAWSDHVVTQLEPLEAFWKADDYMQDYYSKNPNQGYCQIVIEPKIQKLRQKFVAKLRTN